MTFINEAGWDRIVRILLGIALLYLGWTGIVSGVWGSVFKVLGFIPLLTGLIGWCPIYALLRVRTNKV